MNGGAVALIVLFVVAVVVLVIGGLYAKKMLDITDPNLETSVDSKDAENAQEFLPFVDIDGSMLDLGNHRYRTIIECSSVNYHLKTETEREVIELSFQRFISSLSFPITFHIQTRVVDNTIIVRELEKDVEKLREENPVIYNYAKTYLEGMRNFDAYIGNVKQKKKYIIIGYEDAYVLGELTDSEKKELSRQQLRDRASFVISQLSSMQIKAHCLDESELIDLLYNAYHREDAQYDISEMLGLGGYTALSVFGEDKLSQLTPEEKIDLELLRVQNMIKEECLDSKLGYEEHVYKEISSIYNGIKELREAIGSPCQTNYSIDIYGDKNAYEESQFRYEQSLNELNVKYEQEVDLNNGVLESGEEISYEYSKTNDKIDAHLENGQKKDWSLDFDDVLNDESNTDIIDFENNEKKDWSLDFDDVLNDESNTDIIDFENNEKKDWSLDFDDVLNDEGSADIIDFENSGEEGWSLDFDDVLNDEGSADIIDFENSGEKGWSLDFDDNINNYMDKELNNDRRENKPKKNNRLTMFD